MGLQIEEEAILQKKPQIEEEAILEAHNTIGITLSLEIGKTLRKTSHVIIAVVQATMKEIVGRKGETKVRVKPLTTRKRNLQQPHVMVILSLHVMMLVSFYHANKPIGLLTQESRITLPHIGRCLPHMPMVTLVESK